MTLLPPYASHIPYVCDASYNGGKALLRWYNVVGHQFLKLLFVLLPTVPPFPQCPSNSAPIPAVPPFSQCPHSHSALILTVPPFPQCPYSHSSVFPTVIYFPRHSLSGSTISCTAPSLSPWPHSSAYSLLSRQLHCFYPLILPRLPSSKEMTVVGSTTRSEFTYNCCDRVGLLAQFPIGFVSTVSVG